FADDVFSLGQLFFFIVTGTNPHNAGALSLHTHEMGGGVVSIIETMRHPDRAKRPPNAGFVSRLIESARVLRRLVFVSQAAMAWLC
ncbi:MAG TPA: hypothetical protein VGL13_13770, partial [Polyangiaceae bacterium]